MNVVEQALCERRAVRAYKPDMLPEDVLENLRVYGLSERHGRALLRLPEAAAQKMALEYIRANGLNVAATEEYNEP